MRIRVAILMLAPVVALFSLTACSSDDEPNSSPSAGSSRLGTPSATLTEIAVPCAEFEDTAQKIVQAQSDLYAGTGSSTTVDDLVAELDALAEGAPDDVRAALAALGQGFRDAEKLLDEPTAANQKALADVAADLSAAGQKVTEYIVDQCRGR